MNIKLKFLIVSLILTMNKYIENMELAYNELHKTKRYQMQYRPMHQRILARTSDIPNKV